MKFLSSDPQRLLTQHQLDHDEAACFVGVGIGKTSATLDAINRLFQQRLTNGVLVMAPMRVANLTWPMEVNKWDDFKWMKVANLRHEAGKRAFMLGKAHIYVCNYEGIPNLLRLIKQRRSKGLGLPYDTLVCDELTKVRNPSGKRAQAYRAYVPRKDHARIWGLTGTPAPNSLLDLFAQIRFLDGGKRLGVSYEHFKQTYFKQAGYGGYKWEALPNSKDAIEKLISPITLTLTSAQWLDIPETIVEDIEIPLGTKISEEYRIFERDLILKVQGTEITAANAASLVGQLLQFTSGAIYDPESNPRVWHRIHDLKLKALEKLIKGKGPVLVACSFRHEQARIRQSFPQARFFDDAKSAGAQMELLEAWNAGKVPMLVAHPKSVGHGLNLQHGGNVIVWFTLTYSREDYEQMIARLARRGQEDITYVYRLMCPDTVDYAVATVIEEKRATEDRLLTALQLLESYREGAAKPVKIKTEELEDWI